MTLQIPACQHLLITLALFLTTTACLPAAARDLVNAGTSTRVKFGDLDLNTDAGRRELLDRLSKAASRVCQDYAYVNWSLRYREAYRSCYASTLASAVDKVHQAQVSALFAAIAPRSTK